MQIAAGDLASPVISGVVSVGLAYLVAVRTNHEKEIRREKEMATLRFMVWQLWRRIFRSGVVEGLEGDILEKNSPITTSLKAFELHRDFVERLREWYEKEGKTLSDLELLIQINANFEKELLAFELQHKLTAGASLAACCFLLRPEMGMFMDKELEDWKKIREEL